ncbi:hypothetical protein [Herbidospora cretacea]|uniref:hypothetical protein n=1 Tax=Herbidospora cretacea TaxID=28444 RepID=UPI0007C756E5|nr:hypothetical protein [Herbidospora cretacea]
MIDACDLTTVTGLRDRLLLVLGLALMGRRSELVALHRADVREVPDGLEVRIATSKTDKDSAGQTVAIPRGSHRSPTQSPPGATGYRPWTRPNSTATAAPRTPCREAGGGCAGSTGTAPSAPR